MEKKTQSSQRLVLFPCPYQGHINPMLQLGTFLHSKGFSITVVHTHFNSPNPSNHPEFTFFPIPDGLTADEISSGNIMAILLALNANCKASFEQTLTEVMEKEPQNKIICIIHDDIMYFSEAVARHLNIPSIMLRTTSVTNFLARSAVLQLHSEDHLPFPDTLSLNPVPQFHPLRYISQVWRVGVQLENELERGEIERAVRTLMVDDDGEAMRIRAKDLKEKIEVCMKKGGSSYSFLNKLVELIMSL
ncbi:hypothetical protein GBA52_021300 [Prunus armeniaca]|nr:hypothetical protein GBA52_021300 [Prunus armeniaca]